MSLDKYLQIANHLDCHYDDETEEFRTSGEWHYIQFDLSTVGGIIKEIDDIGILPEKVSACDCGLGLGTIFYYLYLQSKELGKSFKFTGVEKQIKYIDFLNRNLLHLWEGNLQIIHSDLMDCDFSEWNLIWFFQPFKWAVKAMPFYHKVITEVQSGAIIIGLDAWNIRTYGDEKLILEFNKLEYYKVGGLQVYRKIN